MRIAEYKRIDTKIREISVPILDEEGKETGEFETVKEEIPVMGMVYRDETTEEAEQREAQEAELRKQEEEEFRALPYGERVERLIRERYSLSDELALSRQRETKAEEFAEYFAYCEDCKARAKMT